MKFYFTTLIACFPLLAICQNLSTKKNQPQRQKTTIDSWLLNGNASTNPSVNFLGTTDVNRLVFRTNNIERMTLLPSGNLGVGTADPSRLLVLAGHDVSNNAEVIIKQIAGTTLGAYLTLDNTANAHGRSWSIGSTGSLNYPTVNGALEFYEYGYGTRMIIDSAGNVGIGTYLPTAQLHTTGSVRFEGLKKNKDANKVLGVDNKGNVFMTDIDVLDGWSLSGNAGTNPSTNFLGTTDYTRLALRSNNIERVSISETGYIGINNTAPGKLLSLGGLRTDDNAEIQVKQLAGSALGAYLTLDNTANSGKWWSIGSTGTLNSPQISGALEFYEYGFGTRVIIDPNGNMGVNVGNGVLPTANFHAKGTVRLQDLPSGGGLALVVDDNGNVYKSNVLLSGAAVASSNSDDIQALKDEINNLKQQIVEMRSALAATSSNPTLDKPALFQNVPNPSQNSTVIKFYVPSAQRSEIIISDLAGRKLKSFTASAKGNQQVVVNNKELGNGTYVYSLYCDGKLVESKKMILIGN